MPEVILTLDSSGAIRGLRDYERAADQAGKTTDSAFSKMSGVVSKVGAAAGLLTAALGSAVTVAAVDMVKLAGNLTETQNKFDVVFKGMTDTAEQWAKELQVDYSLTENASKKFLASTQDLLKPMGVAADQAGAMSMEVAKLAVDLGSFNDLPTEKVMEDIQSALVGNYETMKKYGVVVNATTIVQEALNKGLVENAKDLTAAQKAQIAFEQITRASTDAVGDWQRSQDSFNNQLKVFSSNIETIKTRLGEQLLPIANKWLTTLNEWTGDQDNINKILIMSVEAVQFFYNGLKGLELAAKGLILAFAWSFEKIIDYIVMTIKPLDMLLAGFEKLGWIASNPLKDIKKITADFTASAKEGFKSTWEEVEITNNKFEKFKKEVTGTGKEVDTTKGKLDQFKKKVTDTGGQVQDLTKKNQDLTDSVKKIGEAADGTKNKVDEKKDSINDSSTAAEDLVKSNDNAVSSIYSMSEATEQATTNYENLITSTSALRSENDSLIQTTDRLTDSLRNLSNVEPINIGVGATQPPNEGEGQLDYYQRLGVKGVALDGNNLTWDGNQWTQKSGGGFYPGGLNPATSFSGQASITTTNINVNQKVSRSDVVAIASEMNRMESR